MKWHALWISSTATELSNLRELCQTFHSVCSFSCCFFQLFNHLWRLYFVIWSFRNLNDMNLSRVIILDEKIDFASWFAPSFSDISACSEIQCILNYVLIRFSIVLWISSARKCEIFVCIESRFNCQWKFIYAQNFSSFLIILLSFWLRIIQHRLCSFRFLNFTFYMQFDNHDKEHMMQSKSLSSNRAQHLCKISSNLMIE